MRDQKGRTLTEVLVALAITGMIAGLLGSMMYRISDMTVRGNNELRVQHDLQNAAIWLNRDVLCASPPATISNTHAVLTCPDPIVGLTHTITYTLDPPFLIRSHSNGSMLTVSRNVVSVTFTSPVSSCLVITITSRAGNVMESAPLRFDMRLTE